MGSLGGGEIFVILVLALLLFGPRKLPEIGRTVGKAVAEFRNATRQLKQGIEREVQLEEIREVKAGLDDATREIKKGVDAVSRGPLHLAGTMATLDNCPQTTDEERARVREQQAAAEAEAASATTPTTESTENENGGERAEPRTELG